MEGGWKTPPTRVSTRAKKPRVNRVKKGPHSLTKCPSFFIQEFRDRFSYLIDLVRVSAFQNTHLVIAFCSSWNLCNLARTSSLCSSEYVSSFAISSNFRFSLSISTCLAIALAIADLRELLIVLNSLSRP